MPTGVLQAGGDDGFRSVGSELEEGTAAKIAFRKDRRARRGYGAQLLMSRG